MDIEKQIERANWIEREKLEERSILVVEVEKMISERKRHGDDKQEVRKKENEKQAKEKRERKQ